MRLLTLALLLTVITGCNSDSRGTGDAPAHQLPKQAVDVYPMPDGFPNVATLCDGHGHRMYVPTHRKTDVPITVIADPGCGAAAR